MEFGEKYVTKMKFKRKSIERGEDCVAKPHTV